MVYLIIFGLLFVLELLYFRIATKYNIIDNPNERSSHTEITLRGGGIIFWIAALLYLVSNPSSQTIWFFVGMTLLSAVSFADDILSVKQIIRLLFHLLAMTCAFLLTNAYYMYSWWLIAIGYILFIGIINVYNFMDGINGITGLYSIAVLAPLQYVNLYIESFIEPNFIWYPIIASVVFLFFNFRRQAKCFAGDVGSIGIAFWIITLLLLLVIETNSLIWLGLLMVYGVDGVCTILHRIYRKENIFEAHRLHFYQVMANEQKMPHRLVSIIYFVVQLIVSALIIFLSPIYGWWVFTALLVILIGLYGIKFKFMRREKN